MRQRLHHIIYIAIAAILMVGCTEKGKDTVGSREPQASDTLYTWRTAMQVYGYTNSAMLGDGRPEHPRVPKEPFGLIQQLNLIKK